MARYERGAHDPYTDPATGVLRNRVGATDQDTLDAREAAFAAAREQELILRPEAGAYDLAHLQRVHRRLFGDVYDWAGELRTVDISKGTTRFAHHGALGAAGAAVFGELAREGHLRGLPPERFAERVAYHLGEVNVLHPFREGNGRAQRALFGELAREAGYRIVWRGMTREAMTHASIAAFHGDAGPMAALIATNLAPVAAPPLAPLGATVAPAPDGRYVGPVTGVTRMTVTQLVEGALVEHPRGRLTGARSALAVGRLVVVEYAGGIGRVSEPTQQSRPGRGR